MVREVIENVVFPRENIAEHKEKNNQRRTNRGDKDKRVKKANYQIISENKTYKKARQS